MCDFNIAFRDEENPFERRARAASKAFFRNPMFKQGSAAFKMHQYKIHSRGTRLIRRSYAFSIHDGPFYLLRSIPSTTNRSLAIPSNINISVLGLRFAKIDLTKNRFRLLCFISSTRREIKRLNIRVICNFIDHADANISLAGSFSFSLFSLPFERSLRQLKILQYLHNGTQWCIVTLFSM